MRPIVVIEFHFHKLSAALKASQSLDAKTAQRQMIYAQRRFSQSLDQGKSKRTE
jgi:hypothetical protein